MCVDQGSSKFPTSTRHCHQHGVTITRSCIDTDDEHDMLETCRELQINKYIKKNLCVKLGNYQESNVKFYNKVRLFHFKNGISLYINELADISFHARLFRFAGWRSLRLWQIYSPNWEVFSTWQQLKYAIEFVHIYK